MNGNKLLNYFNYIFKNKRYFLIFLIALLISGFYIVKDRVRGYSSVEFIVYGNAKWLIFTNAYFLLMFMRYRNYQTIKSLIQIRIGVDKRLSDIFIVENIILFLHILFYYLIIGVLYFDSYNLIFYLSSISFFILIMIIGQIVRFIFLALNKNIMLGIIISYSLITVYHYVFSNQINDIFKIIFWRN